MGANNLRLFLDFLQRIVFWQLNKINKILFDRFDVFLVTPHDRTIGNTAEEIHFSLILERKLQKRPIFLKRFLFLGAPKFPNHRLISLKLASEEWSLFSSVLQMLLNVWISLQGHSCALLIYLWANFLKMPPSIFRHFVLKQNVPVFYLHYSRCIFHQYVGHELIWRHGFAATRLEKFDPKFGLPNWEQEVQRPVLVEFSEIERKSCKESLQKIGLSGEDWFVCLHNREAGYHQDQTDLRNSSIVNYQLAIKKIVDAGGWVFRMGDSSMTLLPKMERVVDYPFTEFKSELMDLFLVKNCRFYLGQNSGLVDVAYLFGKRCALVNTTEWAIGFPRLENSRVIFKHFYSLKMKRYLAVQELLAQPFSVMDLHHFKRDFEVRENSATEIAELVDEFLSEPEEFNSLQMAFVDLRKKQLQGWLNQELYSDPEQDRILKYRLFSRIDGCKATVGRAYLAQNWIANSLNH